MCYFRYYRWQKGYFSISRDLIDTRTIKISYNFKHNLWTLHSYVDGDIVTCLDLVSVGGA